MSRRLSTGVPPPSRCARLSCRRGRRSTRSRASASAARAPVLCRRPARSSLRAGCLPCRAPSLRRRGGGRLAAGQAAVRRWWRRCCACAVASRDLRRGGCASPSRGRRRAGRLLRTLCSRRHRLRRRAVLLLRWRRRGLLDLWRWGRASRGDGPPRPSLRPLLRDPWLSRGRSLRGGCSLRGGLGRCRVCEQLSPLSVEPRGKKMTQRTFHARRRASADGSE